MSIEPFDPIRYKEGQRLEWGSSAAGWKKWWQRIERDLQPISERMMELADIQPGQRVLDVATGVGEPAVMAAQRVGPAGYVMATDLSPQMLDIGRERAHTLGLNNIDFLEMDGEVLDLPEGSFDAIFCRFGLMFLPNLEQALARMGGLLVAGGRMVAAVWGSPPVVPFISIPMSVALGELDAPPPPADSPGVFGLADIHRLKDTFRRAGFAEVHTEPMTLLTEWLSADDFVSFHLEILTPLHALLANYPIERQINVWRAIARAARQYLTPDGVLHMENEVILVMGKTAGEPVSSSTDCN